MNKFSSLGSSSCNIGCPLLSNPGCIIPPITSDLDMKDYNIINVDTLDANDVVANNIFMIAPFTFTTGGQLNKANEVVLNPADKIYYYYSGSATLPVVIPPNTDPTVGNNWKSFTGGVVTSLPASKVITEDGSTVQEFINNASIIVEDVNYLSTYAGTSQSINHAWPLMLAKLGTGYKRIVIDKNPNSVDGSWTINSPVKIPSNCEVDCGYTPIVWNNQSTAPVTKRVTGMFYAIGTVSSQTTIAANIAAGSSVISVTDVSGIDVGDYVNIEITNSKPQTSGLYPLIYTYAQVVNKIGNNISISAVIDWDINLADQDSYIVKVIKNADCAKNITVKNLRVKDEGIYLQGSTPPKQTDPAQPNYVIGPLFFQYCDNIHVIDVRGESLKCPLVMFREFTRCSVRKAYSHYPMAINSGEGYTVQMSRGSYAFQYECGGYRTRHVCDITSVFYGVMENCWDDTPKGEIQPYANVSFYLHGRYESRIKMKNLYTPCTLVLGGDINEFGNFVKDWSLSDSKIGSFGGRGAIGNSVIENTELGGVEDASYFFETLTLSNFTLLTGAPIWRLETRLSSPRLDNGLYVTNGTKLRTSGYQGFSRVVIDDGTLTRSGGSVTNEVSVVDVKRFYCGGEHINQRYKQTGACESLNFPSSASIELPNEVGIEGAFSASGITSTKLSVTLEGKINSSSSGVARPFYYQQGSGVAYNLNLNLNGLRTTGTWSGGARISNVISVTGVATGCYFEGLSAPNWVDVAGNSRFAWPATFKSYGNVYTDETRNYDNTNRSFIQSVDFGLVSANAESGVVIPTPIWMDASNPAHVSASFNGIIPSNVMLLAGTRTSPSNQLIARVRNFAATTQNIGVMDVAFNYSVIN